MAWGSPGYALVVPSPTGRGGLGFLFHPQHEAALRCLQALFCRLQRADDRGPATGEPMAETLHYLEHQAGSDLRGRLLHLVNWHTLHVPPS